MELDHADTVEQAIEWCIKHRARVKFGRYEVMIVTETHIGCSGPTLLDAVEFGKEIEVRIP